MSTPMISLGSLRRVRYEPADEDGQTLLEERESQDGSSDDCEAQKLKEPDLVTWDGPDDPHNPLNWSQSRKWTATILVSLFTFISPFSSTMVTPALEEIGEQYDIAEGAPQQLVMTIFLLGFIVGPFTLAPLSEIYGRVRVLRYANLVYLLFNTVCPWARTKEQLYAFRFLSGIGGSAPQAVCNGVLVDTWKKEERGKGQAIYGILTFISPTIAPIMGAYIVEADKISWGWIFWITSMFSSVVQITSWFFLKETYAPKILGDKAKHLRRVTQNPDLKTEYDDQSRSRAGIIRRRLIMPFIMLVAHPAVQVPSIFRAVLYGIMYLIISTFADVWTGIYDQNKGQASLNYLSLAIGFIIGLQISHPTMDKLYAYLKAKNNMEEGLPEWRIPPMLIGGILTPIGLLLYGWTATFEIFWVVPNIGCVLIAIGLIIAFQSAQAYVTDAYDHRYAASAAAVGAVMRTTAGFAFPLFAPAMYDAMGLGWGNTMLAGVTLLLGFGGPGVMWYYGAKMRAWSTAGMR
ncbi:unnamed protein product [Discula destructiva]